MIGTSSSHDLIFGYVRVRCGNDPTCVAGAGALVASEDGVGPEEKIVRVCRRCRSAVRGRVASGGSGGYVQRACGIQSAVLQNAHIRSEGGRIEIDGHGVRARDGCRNVLSEEDGLTEYSSGGGWQQRLRVGVARGINDGRHRGIGVVPSNNNNIQVARVLRGAEGDGNLAHRGLRRRIVNLDKTNGRRSRRAGCSGASSIGIAAEVSGRVSGANSIGIARSCKEGSIAVDRRGCIGEERKGAA